MNGDTLVTLQPKTESDPTRYVEACGEFLMLIDADAMDVFGKEFIKRFSSGQRHTGDDDDYV